MKKVRDIGLKLSHPIILFYTLIWLMVLLVCGTVAQKYIGLYQSQIIYFSSWIFWLGPAPLPGGMTTIGVIFICLLCKLTFDSPWTFERTGTLIAHFGALLLLFGGLLTSLYSQEGNMLIYEGASSDYIEDYHERELVVYDGIYGDILKTFPFTKINVGDVIQINELGMTIEIIKKCRNCGFTEISEEVQKDPLFAKRKGRTKRFDLEAIPLETEDEKNKSGIFFKVDGVSEEEDGIYMSVDFINVAPNFIIGENTYNVALRKKRTYLPFKIKLVDFEKKVHPGTDIPKSFKSDVVVIDEKSQWPARIQMNEPLRLRGYTFYQASYVMDGDIEATVLAVVKNAGRMFPYISSIVMCIGLLIHMFLRLPRLIKRK